MILNVHVPGAHPYDVSDEIWQEPLEDAIRVEAETIASPVGRPVPSRRATRPSDRRARVHVKLKRGTNTAKTEVCTARWYAASGRLMKRLSIEIHSVSGAV
jgi:hypothetical protein